MRRRHPGAPLSRLAALLFGLVMAAAALPLAVPLLPAAGGGLHEGDLAPRTLQARHSAQYPSEALTKAARDEAAAAVPAVLLPPDAQVTMAQAEKLDRLLDQVRAIRLRTDLTSQQQLAEINNLPAAAPLSAAGRSSLVVLDRPALDVLATRARRALAEIMERGLQTADPPWRIEDFVAANSSQPPTLADSALRDLLRAFVAPNVQADEAATTAAREKARTNVAPVIQTYSRGQVIVGEGQTLDAEKFEALRATGVIATGFDAHDFAAGAVLAVAFGTLLGVYLYQLQPYPLPALRRLALSAVVIAGMLAAVRFALPQVTPDHEGRALAFALPVATAAMVAASFGGLSFAAVVAAATGFFGAFLAATNPDLAGASFTGPLEALELAMAYTAGGLAGAAAIHRAGRLAGYAASGLAVFASTWLMLAAFWLLDPSRTNADVGWFSLAAAINGLGSAIIATGAYVVLSGLLGVTTRLHLLELAEAGHPLLARLQEEAPGTYHHSIMVGTLAERAAARIGADPLLARVGAYYHDAGKLAHPGHFIENMLNGAPSPHGALSPAESAALIREHVTAGIDIARRYRIPRPVRAFIPEHHGNRLVTYFYRRAVQQAGATPIDPAPFRYAGPLPQSRESGIVMLADSCEAVVRARADRGPAEIDRLVDGVLAERLAEGQLDECDITMRELLQVAASFKATLKAAYHPRIEYPRPVPEELAMLTRIATEEPTERA